jgi:hypothetical protein
MFVNELTEKEHNELIKLGQETMEKIIAILDKVEKGEG